MTTHSTVVIRHLGLSEYQPILDNMRTFTVSRQPETLDELWVLQHPAIYTLGQAGKPEHLLNPKNIPVLSVDRGGQVTYHGPGQLVVYLLININRKSLTTKTFVKKIETSLITTLHDLHIKSTTRETAPGVYVGKEKIASLGLRIKNGCSYHGLSLNVAMDLSPFLGINPCGYANLAMTQIQNFIPKIKMKSVEIALIDNLCAEFSYTKRVQSSELPVY